jgi:uncharacterized DUF497 family protein
VDIKLFAWDPEKNRRLKLDRDVSFEEVVFFVANGQLLDILEHPNVERYGHQRIFVVRIEQYVFLVPFMETETEIFLKTIIPNRKATRQYLKD